MDKTIFEILIVIPVGIFLWTVSIAFLLYVIAYITSCLANIMKG